MQTRLILTFLLLAFSAVPALADSNRVSVDGGRIEGVRSAGLLVYKGIPYAAPPVGSLRWRPPEPVRAWRGVRRTVTYSPACPQVGNYPADAPQEPASEDCLTLNVWTPAFTPTDKLPVMVWIHGGGLMNGSGSVPQYAGDRLAARGVVVVTLNYRLGALGFLAHPQLNRESRFGVSGNYGLMDQIAALQWIKRNIAAFGGDPDRVTIFSQSSGAFSVNMLMVSPMARGLFRRAIAQSGGVFEPVELDPGFTPRGAAEAGVRFADGAGAKSITELRKLPVSALLKTHFRPQFNIDGHVLPVAPHDAYAAGTQSPADLLVGSNTAEGSFFFDPRTVTRENFDSVLSQTYPLLLLKAVGASPGMTDAEARGEALAVDTELRFGWDMWTWARRASDSRDGSVYLYRFAAEPSYRPGHPLYGLGATHGGELPYVFGKLDANAADWTADDRKLSDIIERYWVNFARSGNPNGPGLPQWSQFAISRPVAMQLGTQPELLLLTDDGRLKRIDRVYASARFVNANLYAIAASGLILVLVIVVATGRLVRRRRSRSLSAGKGQAMLAE